jgi:hypothetical protein
MPAVIRQGEPGLGQPAGKGDKHAMSGNTGREDLRAAPRPSPHEAGLLLATVNFDPTILQIAVEALVTPILEVDGQDSLYWVGLASWGLAAVLVCETVRQRLACRSRSGRCRPPALAGPLPEDRT